MRELHTGLVIEVAEKLGHWDVYKLYVITRHNLQDPGALCNLGPAVAEQAESSTNGVSNLR